MHRGYIKDWRKSLDNPLFKKPLVWHFWGYCLKKTSHKDRDIFMNGQMVSIKRGQFVFGRKIASEETGLSEQQIRTCLKHLEKTQNLTSKSTNKYSIITIINWDTYQQDDEKSTNTPTNNQPAINQQSTTDKNVKHLDNDKKLNKKETKKKSFLPYLKEKIIENNFIEIKDHIFEFYTWRMTEKIKGKKQPYESEKGINGLFRNLNGCRDAGLIVSDCIEIAMEKNWLTPDPSYFKKNSNMQNMHNGKSVSEINQAAGESWLAKRKAARAEGRIK